MCIFTRTHRFTLVAASHSWPDIVHSIDVKVSRHRQSVPDKSPSNLLLQAGLLACREVLREDRQDESAHGPMLADVRNGEGRGILTLSRSCSTAGMLKGAEYINEIGEPTITQ